MSLSALVLAGGASRRMGADKPALELEGERLVDRVVRLAREVAEEVVVLSGPARDLRPGGAEEIGDRGRGPLAAVVTGLGHVSRDDVAVLAADAPHPCPELLVRLASRRGDAVAAVPLVDGRLQPLHAVWGRGWRDRLGALVAEGERSPTRALERLDAVVLGVEDWSDLDPDARFAESWNRPDDLPGGVSGG